MPGTGQSFPEGCPILSCCPQPLWILGQPGNSQKVGLGRPLTHLQHGVFPALRGLLEGCGAEDGVGVESDLCSMWKPFCAGDML